jgi:hypothetical protein
VKPDSKITRAPCLPFGCLSAQRHSRPAAQLSLPLWAARSFSEFPPHCQPRPPEVLRRGADPARVLCSLRLGPERRWRCRLREMGKRPGIGRRRRNLQTQERERGREGCLLAPPLATHNRVRANGRLPVGGKSPWSHPPLAGPSILKKAKTAVPVLHIAELGAARHQLSGGMAPGLTTPRLRTHNGVWLSQL